jgi:hypothetical protein
MFKGGGGSVLSVFAKSETRRRINRSRRVGLDAVYPKGQPHHLPEENGARSYFSILPMREERAGFLFRSSTHSGKQNFIKMSNTLGWSARLMTASIFRSRSFSWSFTSMSFLRTADPVLTIEKLASQGDVLAHGLPGQAKLVQ